MMNFWKNGFQKNNLSRSQLRLSTVSTGIGLMPLPWKKELKKRIHMPRPSLDNQERIDILKMFILQICIDLDPWLIPIFLSRPPSLVYLVTYKTMYPIPYSSTLQELEYMKWNCCLLTNAFSFLINCWQLLFQLSIISNYRLLSV